MTEPDWRIIELENQGLYIQLDFAEEVAQRYGHRDPERLKSKLLYFGLVDQIGTILDGAGLALKGQEDLAWLQLKRLLRRCESDV
jgi:hypothetical protein